MSSLPFPTGEYKAVVIDPPWPITDDLAKRRLVWHGDNDSLHTMPYKTMSLEQISNIEIPSILAAAAIVFVWTTQKFLPACFDLLKAWELTYRYTMIWHKPTGPTFFHYPVGNAEFVVVGSKGKMKLLSQKQFMVCFNAPQRGHSVKPAEFYNTIARVTEPPRLDIFSRRLIPGFDVWGDEVPTEILPASQYPLFE